MSTTAAAPVVTRGATAEKLAHAQRSVMTLLADSSATGGALSVTRSTFPDGGDGAPSHFHTGASESLFVISGRLQVLTGDEVVVLEAGDFVSIPAGLPHAFGAAPGSDADVLAVFAPAADRFDYYRLLERVAAGEADPAEIPASASRYDNHYVASEAWRRARAGE
ncbi:cupin domain-containing protein [Glycomyces harbinensis]|uniref:Cupin domain-containing protein n=1 Tax=Glycomyces harbinensis TaxID=58114 RepID=A0A1G6SSQ1_9ACTN|nr:cupin domain-containing protein [Glycomyces harbinensis]SDD19257.1 Cupin domain-containing protein [Glycomyces harbinensis]